ncbi:MAG: hypothetical protein ABID87_01840 [Chloroflexota bacterium]
MKTATVSAPESTLGSHVHHLRRFLRLSRETLAILADVSPEEVALLEQGLPVRLDTRRRVLRELWTRKARGQA